MFNPPFAKGVKIKKRPVARKEHPVFRFRGALATRSKKVPVTLPKLPEEKSQ